MKKTFTERNRRFGDQLVATAASLGLAGACTLMGFAPAAGQTAPAGNTGDYVVGVQIDQSGISRSVGVPQLQGIQMAIDGANRRGGVNGHKIQLVVRDDGSDAARAVSVYRELADQYKVSAIAGFVGSVAIPPVAPLAARQKIALLVTGAPASLLDPPSPAIFSTIANLNAQGRAGLDYIKRLSVNGALPKEPRVALLYYASPAGQNWHKEVVPYAASLGLNIVAAENSTVGAATLDTQMNVITAAKPNTILAFDIETDMVNAAKAGKAAGLDLNTVIVDYSFASNPSALSRVTGQGFPNFVASANFRVPGGNESAPGVKLFAADAEAANLSPDKVLLPEGYAQGLLIVDVLTRCGFPCPSEKFLEHLEKTDTDLQGLAFGPIKYARDFHQGVTAVRFRQWDTKANTHVYAGDPIPLRFK